MRAALLALVVIHWILWSYSRCKTLHRVIKIQQPCPRQWSLGVLQPPADMLRNPWWIEPQVYFQFAFGEEKNKNRCFLSYPPTNAKEKEKEK